LNRIKQKFLKSKFQSRQGGTECPMDVKVDNQWFNKRSTELTPKSHHNFTLAFSNRHPEPAEG
jgi:hypothetical protein